MRSLNRRSATRVRDGRVQKKNNWAPDGRDVFAVPQHEIRIERRDPGEGYRHLVSVAQLRTFLDLLPVWDEVAVGLEAIVLDTGWWDTMGWHQLGVVALCAWERELWSEDGDASFDEEHGLLLDLLEVERVLTDDGYVDFRWTEAQARAFQLLHILPHELGHHHDRMTTRSQRGTARGETFAEQYADAVLADVWPAYTATFGI